MHTLIDACVCICLCVCVHEVILVLGFVKVLLPRAEGLDLDDLQGSFHLRSLYDSMIASLMKRIFHSSD